MDPVGLARRATARLAHSAWLRRALYPLRRRFPSLAMAIHHVAAFARDGQSLKADVASVPAKGAGDLGETARGVLADLERAGAAARAR